MSSQGSRKRFRRESLGLLVVLAMSGPLVAPDGATAAKFNLGGGVVHGEVVFDDPGLSGDPNTCVSNLHFSIEAVAPGVAYNTVTTGFVGDLEMTGDGWSDCGTPLGSGGTLTLHVTGTGPTGSEIVCDPLQGGFSRTATVVTVDLFGSCTVNNYGTAQIQFLSVLQFTPTAPTGAPATGASIKEAIFDGDFVIVPAAS
jgi:hypothetical protein